MYLCTNTDIQIYAGIHTHLSFEDTNTLSPQPCFLQNYALRSHHFLGELQLHHTSTPSLPFPMFFAVVQFAIPLQYVQFPNGPGILPSAY